MDVIIIGAGFAGIAAARQLSCSRNNLHITLINQHTYTQFRPLLPDIISRSVSVRYLWYSLERLAQKLKIRFMEGKALVIDTNKKKVIMETGTLVPYDFLVLATGSTTAIPTKIKEYGIVNTLDALGDGQKIAKALHVREYHNYVICGGGYTGIETATHICKGLQRYNINGSVKVVEMKDTILSHLPPWMRTYARNNCEGLGIEIKVNTKITDIQNDNILLSDNSKITNARLIWSTGLKANVPRIDPLPSFGEGNRVKVNNDLRISEVVFAVGDCACCTSDNGCYRMAVQSSLTSGTCAAENILALINGYKTCSYHFSDPGFIVPMANWYSCGEVLGRKVHGAKATLLHYVMSVYRSKGWKSRIGIMVNELKSK